MTQNPRPFQLEQLSSLLSRQLGTLPLLADIIEIINSSSKYFLLPTRRLKLFELRNCWAEDDQNIEIFFLPSLTGKYLIQTKNECNENEDSSEFEIRRREATELGEKIEWKTRFDFSTFPFPEKNPKPSFVSGKKFSKFFSHAPTAHRLISKPSYSCGKINIYLHSYVTPIVFCVLPP